MLQKMDVKCFALFGIFLCIIQTVCGFSWYRGQGVLRENSNNQMKDESIFMSLQKPNPHLLRRQRRSSYNFIKHNNLNDKNKYGIHSRKMQKFARKLQRIKLVNSILKQVPVDYYLPPKWSRPSSSKNEITWIARTPAITKTTNFKDILYESPATDTFFNYEMPKPTTIVEPQPFSSENADKANIYDPHIALPHFTELAFPPVPLDQTGWLNLETMNENPYSDSSPVDIPNSGSFENFRDNNDDTIPVPVGKSTRSWGDVFSPAELSDLNFGDFNMNSGFNWNGASGSTAKFAPVLAPPGGFGSDGSFVTDTSGCEDIETKTCTTDKDCSCNGFYLCSKGKCQTISSHQSDENVNLLNST